MIENVLFMQAEEQWLDHVQNDFFDAGVRHIIKPVPNKKFKSRKQEGEAVSIFAKHLTDYFASILQPSRELIFKAVDHLRFPEEFSAVLDKELASRVNMTRVYKVMKKAYNYCLRCF